ncbi:MAG: T9SS type A sorting domain-containing protein [Bacteroidales bacterium]
MNYYKTIFTKIAIFSLILHLSCKFSYSQSPVLHIDLNVSGRTDNEVNEPGYSPWVVTSPGSKNFAGVTFTFKNGTVQNSWYKVGVQAPYYARIVGDGIWTENIELHISGLQNGKHSLLTFHNTFDDKICPIDIYIGRTLIIDNLVPSKRVYSNNDGETSYLEFEVTNSEDVVIRYMADPVASSTGTRIPICGFQLNKTNPKKMARYEYPEDKDEHVDIDNDTLKLYWKSPEDAVAFHVFFGKNKSDVFTADTLSPQFTGRIQDTSFTRANFYNLDSNFWRIDPIDTSGNITKGEVWYFKNRKSAFPGAEGHGRYAIGGRGGKVAYVTNLNDNGPGSFRHAVDNTSGPTTILFKVSGIITLNSRLVIRNNYITVAGQSAPGKGICFRWAPIGVTGNDLIVQNIRMRLGIGVTFDGMGLTGANNSIIDHCSISWSIDEAFSSRSAKNITLQRTLISEALNRAGHDVYGSTSEHGFAASISGDIGSFHHNLLAHCNGRNWSLAGGLDGDQYYAGRLDLFNNVVYNWGKRATDGGAHEVNFVANYYKKGEGTNQNTILRAQLEGKGKGSQSYFFDKNIVENKDGSLACDGTDNTCSRTYELSGGQILDWEVFVDQPFFESDATIHDAKDAYKLVLSDVGCNQPVFDDHDIRIVNETLNGTFSLRGGLTNSPGFPDHEKDAGYWEVYPGYMRSPDWDSDLDGLPNWWEKAHGLDTNSLAGDFSESNADDDRNGYTRLEEYLHWMAKPHYFMQDADSIDINLADLTRGFTNNPVYNIIDVENGIARLLTDSSIVRFTAADEGFAEIVFKVLDAEGTSFTQQIGIYKGKTPCDSSFTYTYMLDRSATVQVTVDSVNTYTKLVSHVADYEPGAVQAVLFPNPANGTLSLMVNDLDKDIVADININNLTGQTLIREKDMIIKKSDYIFIDISLLKPGIYLLNVRNNYLNISKKFLKL